MRGAGPGGRRWGAIVASLYIQLLILTYCGQLVTIVVPKTNTRDILRGRCETLGAGGSAGDCAAVWPDCGSDMPVSIPSLPSQLALGGGCSDY